MKKFFFLLFFILIAQSASNSLLKIISHSETFQGRSFLVFIANAKDVKEARTLFNGSSYKFYKYEDGLRVIIPVAPEEKAGVYPLVVEGIMPRGNIETFESTIVVSQKQYPKASFWLKPSRKKLLTSDIVAQEWAKIEEKLLQESENKLWNDFFKKPVSGITTMAFGAREFVNGKARGRHRGWDFRAKVGTKVKAPNNSRVVFAKNLKAFGGTVVLDHGQGINTLYFHLSKILVNEGDDIKKGDMIALTGNTGISSGPHLHWGMSVHNVRVDPNQWVMTVMP